MMFSMELSGEPGSSFVTPVVAVIATLLMVLDTLSFLGGICSLRRTVWGWCLLVLSPHFFIDTLGDTSYHIHTTVHK